VLISKEVLIPSSEERMRLLRARREVMVMQLRVRLRHILALEVVLEALIIRSGWMLLLRSRRVVSKHL